MTAELFMTFAKRALKDMVIHKIQHGITVITITLCVFIISTVVLFTINVNHLLRTWQKGLKIIAYVNPTAVPADIHRLNDLLETLPPVERVLYISKDTALQTLINQMPHQSSIFEDLKENPLPDAFEIYVKGKQPSEKTITGLARHIQALPMIDDVEYGGQWIKRIMGIINLIRYTGLAISALLLMVTMAIIVNTFRLALYGRREEIEVMRLVGATDTFIKAPFYVEALIQGTVGGLAGQGTLMALYGIILTRAGDNALLMPGLQFPLLGLSGGMVLGAALVGWLGCFLSLRQYLRI